MLFVSVDTKPWQPQWVVSSNENGRHAVCIRVISPDSWSNVAWKKKDPFVKLWKRNGFFTLFPHCSFICSFSILLFHSGIVQTRLALTIRPSENPPIFWKSHLQQGRGLYRYRGLEKGSSRVVVSWFPQARVTLYVESLKNDTCFMYPLRVCWTDCRWDGAVRLSAFPFTTDYSPHRMWSA